MFNGFITEPAIEGPLDGKPVTATIKIKVTDVQVDGEYDTTGAVDITLAT